jgi:multidrug resistance efflux pump
MIRRSLLLVFWVLIVIVLLLFSLVFKDTTSAIVAQVEPMKHAISYHKAVRIEEVFVIPGQRIQPGDVLVRVVRPDLVLDEEKKQHEIEKLKIERSLIESKYRLRQQQLMIDKETDLRKITSEIEQLEVIMTNNRELSSQFGALTGYSDTLEQHGKSYYEIELEVLNKEMEVITDTYRLQTASLKKVHEEELRSFDILATQLHHELNVLIHEQEQQVRTAEIHGTVGSVNVQPGELLSPYTTILSIYESNPSIIKAVMNEGYKYEMEVGDIVSVESSNRQYSIDGKVIEIGARIIEYPNRLKTNQNLQMWGQEVFIKIPEDNMLLNGERVFVTIKK